MKKAVVAADAHAATTPALKRPDIAAVLSRISRADWSLTDTVMIEELLSWIEHLEDQLPMAATASRPDKE